MVKFSALEDDGFQSVAAELRRWTKDKITPVRLPHSETIPPDLRDPVEMVLELVGLIETERSRAAMKSCLRYLNLEGAADALVDLANKTDKESREQCRIIKQRLNEEFLKATTRCRKSLTFDELMAREEIIARPEHETCQWIYSNLEYLKWTESNNSLLWIKGSPGSGKSILMKSLFKQHLKDFGCSKTILLRFFFNARGSNMERSSEALYRTLLHDLTTLSPLTSCEILATYLKKENRFDLVRWRTAELADLFHDQIERLQSEDVEVLIDALDECSDDEVLDVVRRFERSIQSPRHSTVLRVCWSSRFYPNISLVAAQGINLFLSENNIGDIQKHVYRTFPMHASKQLRAIGEDIVRRSRGIFLWASLVAGNLKRAFDAGKDANQLKDMLGVLPDSLDNLFYNIFDASSYTPEQHKDLMRIVYIVLGVLRPLSVQEMYTAVTVASSNRIRSLDEATLRPDSYEQFRKRLTHASGGLIEVVDLSSVEPWDSDTIESSVSDGPHTHEMDLISAFIRYEPQGSTRVQFIHESVREFFFEKGLSVLRVPSKKALIARCHSEMTRIGFECLIQGERDLGNTEQFTEAETMSHADMILNRIVPRGKWRPSPVEFLSIYVWHHVFTHFHACQSDEDSKSNSRPPPPHTCRDALYAFLRIACSKAVYHRDWEQSFHPRLSMLLSCPEVFELDKASLASLLDLPIQWRIMTCCLERRAIQCCESRSNSDDHGEEKCDFLAVFSAQCNRYYVGTPKQNHSQTSFVPTACASEQEIIPASDGDTDEFKFLTGISFSVPESTAKRIMLPDRFYAPGSEDFSRAINIEDWKLVNLIESDLCDIMPTDPLIGRLDHQLVLSKSEEVVCSLFKSVPIGKNPSATRLKHRTAFFQSGRCALRLEDAQDCMERLIISDFWN